MFIYLILIKYVCLLENVGSMKILMKFKLDIHKILLIKFKFQSILRVRLFLYLCLSREIEYFVQIPNGIVK